MTEQQAQGAEQQNTSQQAAQAQQTPPWGDDASFDPAKAWKLIQDLRTDKEKLAARPVLDDDAKAKLGKYDALVAASQTDLEKAQADLTRWQSEAERWRSTSVASTIKALAASDFEYPDDAVTALDPTKYLDAGGTIDEKAIKADLDGLLESRPNWRKAAAAQGPRTPAPNRSQGSGGGNAAPDPAQLFASILQNGIK